MTEEEFNKADGLTDKYLFELPKIIQRSDNQTLIYRAYQYLREENKRLRAQLLPVFPNDAHECHNCDGNGWHT